MTLEQVLSDVRRDGESRARAILDAARAEAERILADARAKAQAYEAQRMEDARRDADRVVAQGQSRADSESRKAVLAEEATLRRELREAVLKSFAALPAKTRDKHVQALVKRAQELVPKGRVWGAAADAAALKGQKAYAFAGEAAIAGGIVVESEDGTVRLDLSYETTLDEMWRDVLKAESAVFR